VIAAAALAWLAVPASAAPGQGSAPAPAAPTLRVASKNFTENRLLAEIVAQLVEAETDLEVEHRASLGGTKVCWAAMLAGQVDLYVDYTGTGWSIVLKEEGKVADPLRAFLHVQHRYRALYDVEWLPPFGLNNTYALALARGKAEELGATRISDLAGRGGELDVAFSIEFMNREDGWPGLRDRYGLDLEPRGMEHALAYEALGRGQVDLVDAYSTDGKLGRYDVVVLEDDLGFFPPYNAAPLVRGETLRALPELREVLWKLAFTIDDERAMELNRRVEVDGEAFEAVARSFLIEAGLVAAPDATPRGAATPRGQRGLFSALVSERARIGALALEHVVLVAIAVAIAAALAIPLGVLITHVPALRRPLLGGASVLQTVPSLALLAFLIAVPWLGLGVASAIVALVLYAVLPILRNTFTGLDSVDPELIDAARGLGLTPRQVLLRIQLPLATRTILAGLRTAAVISVGIATLAAFIGAGGLGQPIVEGLYLNDTALVLSGALPAAVLALAVDGLLGLAERALVPRGLRGALA
jgi:osmoprotectant transport system permease protein